MSKKRCSILYIFILCVLFVTSIIFLNACSSENLVSITISGDTEILAGNFDFSNYMVEATYDTGGVKKVELTKDMLSSEDYLKVFSDGDKTLTINYGGLTCELNLKVCLYEFTDLKFNDIETTYSGSYVTAEVVNNYPEGTTVYYPSGNSFLNAGTYEVTAIVSRRNYITQTLTATVVINQAEYDMSNVSFIDTTFEYDGKEHSTVITGDLPSGVTVTYPDNNNKKINAGTYDVKACFSFDGNNYKQIPDMTAKMTINKKKYNTENLTFSSEKITYDGKEHTLQVSNCPSNVRVEYQVGMYKNDKYTDITGSKLVDADTYYFTAKFYSNDVNYEDIPDMHAQLIIDQAIYDTSIISMDSKEVDYNGKPQTLTPYMLDGSKDLPSDLYILYSYYTKDGKEIIESYDEDNSPIYAQSVTDYGTYVYTVQLWSKDENYYVDSELTATLIINKIDYNVDDVSVDDYKYTGEKISVTVNNIPSDLSGNKLGVKLTYFTEKPALDENGKYNYITDNEGNPVTGVTDEGDYFVMIEFTDQNNENYNELKPIVKSFKITKEASV